MQPDHRYYSIGMNPSPRKGELTVLFSGEGRPNGGHGIGPSIHEYYLLHTVLSGKGTFTLQGQSYVCREGDTFAILPGEMFTYQADERDPWHYVWVAYIGRGAAAITASVGLTPENAVVSGSLNANTRNCYYRLHDCFLSAAPPELANLEAEGWVRLLLREFGEARRAEAGRPPRPEDPTTERLIKQAKQYMMLQFMHPISIDHLAGMLGYHRAHLTKLFKQKTGLSPMQFLQQIRMERAEQLLATTMTVEAVASAVGFGDALYFSRKFRKWRGLSPTEHRQAQRDPPRAPQIQHPPK